MQRNASDDVADFIARDLDGYVKKNPAAPYAHIREVFAKLDSDIEDNVAAAFVELQMGAQLEKFAGDPQGFAVLDVLTEAMLTGSVTSFEALQAERILIAKGGRIPAEQYAAGAARIARLRNRAEDSGVDVAVDQQALRVAHQLDELLAAHRYADVTSVVRGLSSGIEDNVASQLVELQTTAKLEQQAADRDGRVMLNVLYYAMITGDVSAFERLQAERILEAEAKAAALPTGTALTKAFREPVIFPLATSWGSTATIVASLESDGTVKVYYDSWTGVDQPKFRPELNTLTRRYGESKVKTGIPLQPDEPVMVKLYDQGGALQTVPAIKLIDYFNQQKQDTLGKIKSVSFLAATAGAGGIGAAGVLGWADTVTFAISAGSLFVNAYREEIANTAFGRAFLKAWSVAEGIADYYGWARLGVDGLRLVHSTVRPAYVRWRGESSSGLSAAERDTIMQAQQKTEAWLDGVEQAEAAEAVKLKGGAAKDAHGPTAGHEPPASHEHGAGHEPGTARPAPAEGPSATVAVDAESEIHVHDERIEVCQRCEDLKDAVGDVIEDDTKVAKEVEQAQGAARRGDPVEAGQAAKAAVLDARKSAAASKRGPRQRYKREFASDESLGKEWNRIKRIKRGSPERVQAERALEERAARVRQSNDQYVAGVKEQAAAIRKRIATDRNAAHELGDLYRKQPEWVLTDLKRAEKEALAAQKRKRVPTGERDVPDDQLAAELEKKEMSAADLRAREEQRGQHDATVRVVDKNGKVLSEEHYASGGVTELEREEHGLNEANSRSHTEAKALREQGIRRGETMVITGKFDPCKFCLRRMKDATARYGGTIVYWWPGGPPGGWRIFAGEVYDKAGLVDLTH